MHAMQEAHAEATRAVFHARKIVWPVLCRWIAGTRMRIRVPPRTAFARTMNPGAETEIDRSNCRRRPPTAVMLDLCKFARSTHNNNRLRLKRLEIRVDDE
jgi:hypothetical protein